jgi:hypothetical protein
VKSWGIVFLAVMSSFVGAVGGVSGLSG